MIVIGAMKTPVDNVIAIPTAAIPRRVSSPNWRTMAATVTGVTKSSMDIVYAIPMTATTSTERNKLTLGINELWPGTFS